MRAAGANAWHMSHNPPLPKMLDTLDNLGIVVWDENGEFGENLLWIQNQRYVVKRDRNHPSVMIWSFCNEAGCTNGNARIFTLAGEPVPSAVSTTATDRVRMLLL